MVERRCRRAAGHGARRGRRPSRGRSRGRRSTARCSSPTCLGPSVTAIDSEHADDRARPWTHPRHRAARRQAGSRTARSRGLYDVAARPGNDELWVAHLMLGTDTPQPDLDFESTVFPSLSICDADGALPRDAVDRRGGRRRCVDGSIGDIVSGPHAIAFTQDGALALVVDTNSEDLLAIDAVHDVQGRCCGRCRGTWPRASRYRPTRRFAYIDERNTWRRRDREGRSWLGRSGERVVKSNAGRSRG